MRNKRRPIEVFSLSFLDVISCGFGAIILLLVLTLALEPATLVRITADLSERVETAESSREQLVIQGQNLNRELTEKREELTKIRQGLDRLNQERQSIQDKNLQVQTRTNKQALFQDELESVLQALNEEMKNLLSQPEYRPPAKEATIGGIPVDSEYIIFIIDTSGSMLRAAWPAVIRKVREVLSVYPHVKGIQVINDMGSYMFGEYAGHWIPDTPARRKEVLKRLKSWKSFSNSSPVEGVTHAVRRYFKKDKHISLYVFGDDFSSGNIDAVLDEVVRFNKKDASGKPRVRIHAFGFPVLFANPEYGRANKQRFAHLMRLLAEQNAGSFVGLTSLK